MKRFARSMLWGLLALCAPALPLANAAILGVEAPADTHQTSREWLLHPSEPCVRDDVVLFVRAFSSTPCDSFIGAGRVGEREVVIRTLVHEGVYCFAAPAYFAMPIPFGMLPAGPQVITIRHRFLRLGQDGSLDSTTVEERVEFQVGSECPSPVPVPALELPFVTRVGTDPAVPCPAAPTHLVLGGFFRDGCGEVVETSSDTGRAAITLAPYPPRPTPCPAYMKPWSASFPLGFLQSGFHRVLIAMTVRGTNGVWPPILDQRYLGEFSFQVFTTCDSFPPFGLPYVDFIRIGPAAKDSSLDICPSDSIRVVIGGSFPSDCFRLKRIDLLDLWLGLGPLPRPPIVRLVVDDGGCLGRPCGPGPVPWKAAVTLAPLPSRDYFLPVQLAQVSCFDSILPGNLYSTSVPFRVQPPDSCGIPVDTCLRGWWEGGTGRCNGFISPGRSAELTFQVFTKVALAGLQGALRFWEPGMLITRLETTGPAVGMHLSWTPTMDGARFVMFAERGAPIPASFTSPVSVLRVTAELRPWRADSLDQRIPWPPAFHLAATELLGADVEGREVPQCLTVCPYCEAIWVPPVATICFERPCDFNADGTADVRDLVLMVHCVNGSGPCPPDAATRFDCNGDGQFGLSDVLCCAVHVLRGIDCPDCPVDSTRAEPGVRASFGAPLRTARGVDLPLRLEGADRLGAARLALQIPTDRFELVGVDLPNARGEWLELHEGEGLVSGDPPGSQTGERAIVLIRTGMITAPIAGFAGAAEGTLEMILHLDLEPGAQPGGEARLEGGEFSGPDGVTLEVDLGAPSRSLGEVSGVGVSAIRPNPSPGMVRFSITLSVTSRLELGIYDVTGRRVAEVFRGERNPGTHDFVWDGRATDGSPAREGVYFLRAVVGSRAVTKKLVLLRRNVPPGAMALPP